MDVNFILDFLVELTSSWWNSGWFFVVKLLIGIYVAVLFVDIVLLLFVRGLGGDWRKMLYGSDLPPAHRGKTAKTWKQIEARLTTRDESQWKAAILEADALVDSILNMAGFSGENMHDRLVATSDIQVVDKEHLLWAHEIRNRVIRQADFSLDEETANKVIDAYREFLKGWEAL